MIFSQSLFSHLQNGVTAALPTPRPAVRLKGDNKHQSTLGTSSAGRGEGLRLGTPTSSTWTRNMSGRPSAASPTPGRTAPKGPSQVLPSFLYLPGRRSSGEGGRARLGPGHPGARSVEEGVTQDPQSQLGAGLGQLFRGLDTASPCQGGCLSLLGLLPALLLGRLPNGAPCCPHP